MKKFKKFLMGLLCALSVTALTVGLTGCEDENPSVGTGNGATIGDGFGDLGGGSSDDDDTQQGGGNTDDDTQQGGGNADDDNTERGDENTDDEENGDDTDIGDVHTHIYDQEVTEEEYLQTVATCTNAAIYYKSCTCGEIGTDTFTHGEVGEHVLDASGICSACEQPIEPTEGLLYDVSLDGTYAEVVGYQGTTTKVRIADTYHDLPVKSIYNEVFKDMGLVSIVIPDSVTTIRNDAFAFCDSLTSVTIPDSVRTIEIGAFEDCDNLASATFENPNGWWYYSDATCERVVFEGLYTRSRAALCLSSLYDSYCWYRS